MTITWRKVEGGSHAPTDRRAADGFTLVELLLVITIVGILLRCLLTGKWRSFCGSA